MPSTLYIVSSYLALNVYFPSIKVYCIHFYFYSIILTFHFVSYISMLFVMNVNAYLENTLQQTETSDII